jgi:uncharacterized membrane protein YfcA
VGTEDLALALVVLLALLVEACAGFGATVVTVALGALILPIPAVLAAFVPVNLILSLYLVARERAWVDRAVLLRRVLPWMGAGFAVGVGVYQRASGARWLPALFGAFVVVLSAISLWGLRPSARASPRLPAAPCLLAAGVVHGVFATGGPLVVYAAEGLLPDKRAFRATLAAVWLPFHGLLLASYGASGALGAASLRRSALLLPALALGLPLGQWAHRRLPEARFRVGVYALLLVAGGVPLLRAVLR